MSPSKRISRFGIRDKLNPRYVGPFEILERIGEVAYRLALPPSLVGVHDIFHISMLKKYLPDPSHIMELEPLQAKKDLSYEEYPVRIMDCKEQVLRYRNISHIKVQWSRHSEREAT